jgi:hypothetical protein
MRRHPRLCNIQRNEHHGFSGWAVRVKRGGRMVHQRYFSDRRFGGKRQALARALKDRDAVLRKLPRSHPKQRSVSNKTGVVGVFVTRRLSRRRAKGKRRVLRYYEANWMWPPGSRRQVQRSFSWTKYGREEAWRLAVEARRAALRRIAQEERRAQLAQLDRDRVQRR